MDTQKLDQTYIANTYARFPVTIVKGKGSPARAATGKEYIDLSTGIAVDIFGVADEEWMAAVTKQLGTLQHISNLYYTEPCVKLAQMLCEKTGMKKVFFGNSGAEANECAIKAARKWSEEKKGKDYSTIITLKNSFHGRTITTLAATGQDVFHHDFTPLTEGFVYAEPNDLADLEQLIKANKCAAVMMEVVQGEGGVMPLGEAYVKGAAKLCEQYDLLLICDEVQVGNGRSGKLYGYMHYGVQPDIVSTAKGLGGGLPLGDIFQLEISAQPDGKTRKQRHDDPGTDQGLGDLEITQQGDVGMDGIQDLCAVQFHLLGFTPFFTGSFGLCRGLGRGVFHRDVLRGGRCKGLILARYLQVINGDPREKQRQDTGKRLEAGGSDGHDDPDGLHQHPAVVGKLQFCLAALFVRLVKDLLHDEADARKVCDGDGCAHEPAQHDGIVELDPAHQMQRREDHPHGRRADGGAAGDAQQFFFGFRLQFHSKPSNVH